MHPREGETLESKKLTAIMASKRTAIKLIEDKGKRHTAFSKRRGGLFRKVKNYCELAGAQAAVIVFSKAGNLFGFGHPAVDGVLNRYIAARPSDFDGAILERAGGGAVEVEEAPPLTEMETRFSEAMKTGQPAWEDVLMRDLGLKELGELEETVKMIKTMTAQRLKELEAAGGDFPARKEVS